MATASKNSPFHPLAVAHGLTAALVALSACAPTAPDPREGWDARARPLTGDNGLSPNGLTTNGITTNGITTNGITTNGLTTNGMMTASFSDWFSAGPDGFPDMVMRYLVACAVGRGEARVWTNPSTGVSYSWPGNLGLTPHWASGEPASELEQQLVTACLAAHVNKYGLHVMLSARGADALGRSLSLDPGEDAAFTDREGCFFGNLFTGAGAFSGSDRVLGKRESTVRACGLSSQGSGTSVECPPMVHVGECDSYCTYDASLGYYTRCVYGGKTYQPITTRLRAADIYSCGDGVCQFTESCGNTKHYDGCKDDCGKCP